MLPSLLLPDLKPSICVLHLCIYIYIFCIFHVNDIYHIAKFLSFIHAVMCVSTLLFLWLNNILLYIFTTLYSSLNFWLMLEFLTIVNSANMNMHNAIMSLSTCLQLFWVTLRSGIIEPYDNFMANFLVWVFWDSFSL
jgi:hypothetical protein